MGGLGGRPSLQLGDIDKFLLCADDLLHLRASAALSPQGAAALKLLVGKGDSPEAFKLAGGFALQLTMVDAIMLLATSVRQLCEHMGHYPAGGGCLASRA